MPYRPILCEGWVTSVPCLYSTCLMLSPGYRVASIPHELEKEKEL